MTLSYQRCDIGYCDNTDMICQVLRYNACVLCCTGWCSPFPCTDLPCVKENEYPSFYIIGSLYVQLYMFICAQ